MTPYELKILIHIITCGGHFHVVDNKLRQGALTQFENVGAIIKCDEERNDHGYSATDLGRAWLASILKTEPPTMKYVDKSGEIIDF